MTQHSIASSHNSRAEGVLEKELATVRLLVNYHAWIFSTIQHHLGKRLIEIGGGIGTFSDLLINRHLNTADNRTLEILEPSEQLFEHLSLKYHTRYPDLLRTGRLTLTKRVFTAAPEQYDTVVMINVLEHIEQDQYFADGVFKTLSPGGTFIVFSPALPFLYSELDHRVGHFRRYTKCGLASIFTSSGFHIEQLRYMDMVGIIPWYLINVLAGSCSFNSSLTKIYDRFVVPFTRFAEDSCGAPIGKNLLIVGRKPQ
ncbi:MAG: class I SAM-dependent methyltransferase [Nitrospira sp.]|nr:class I SAM-dependent methyltransferase [Nitrospira sp.]